MKYLSKKEVLILLDEGKELLETKVDDIGTTSMTKPIRISGKKTSKFYIDGHKVHHNTGYSLIKELKKVGQKRVGLFANQTTYKK